MPKDASKARYIVNYIWNMVRTWWKFHVTFPWVKYQGFERISAHTTFTRGFRCEMGHNVQFGQYCVVANDVVFGSNILMAGHVYFIGRNDHTTDVPCQRIWDGPRGG